MGDNEHVEVSHVESQSCEGWGDELADRARAPRVQQQPPLADEREQIERSATDLRLDPMYAWH
jgi:hypothetical protein